MNGVNVGKEDIGDMFPTLQEGRSLVGGIQRIVGVPMGAPLLVDGVTYKGVVFVAPCNGCLIKEVWIATPVAMAGGTNTLAVDNYDKSATTARNVLSTTSIAPETITALQGLQLTLVTVEATLSMDEGDVLNFVLVCGTMTTDGQGYFIQAVVWVPDVI